MSDHTAKLQIEADYAPHWSWECADPTECRFFNEDTGECNAVVWLENDDAANESLESEFTAWEGPVKIAWEDEFGNGNGYYSFQPLSPPLAPVPNVIQNKAPTVGPNVTALQCACGQWNFVRDHDGFEAHFYETEF